MRKMLKKEEELSLARAWLDEGSERARARLLDAYQPMVRNISRRYLRAGLSAEDLIQEGNIGFLAALDNFEPDKGYAVGTLARFHIRARVQLYVSAFAGIIRLPNSRRIKGLLSKCISQIRFEESVKGRTLTNSEKETICAEAGYTLAEVEQYEMVMRPAKSIQAQVSQGEEESGFELVDEGPDAEQLMVEADSIAFAQETLGKVIETLPERTRTILRMRHLGETFVSLDSIAAEVGISRERVRRIESDALQTIRKELDKLGISSLDDLL